MRAKLSTCCCTPQGVFKIIQLLLGCSCLGLWRLGGPDFTPLVVGETDVVHVIVTTFAAFILCSTTLLISHCLDEDVYKTVVECVINPVGGIMYVATSVIIVELVSKSGPLSDEYTRRAVALASMALLNGIVYFCDAILALRNRRVVWWK